MDKKPNVFPTKPDMSEAMKQANETGTKIAEQANKELNVNPDLSKKSKGELAAEAQMKQETLDKMQAQVDALDELLKQRRAEKSGTPLIKEEIHIEKEKTTELPNPNDKIDDIHKWDYLGVPPQDNVPHDVIKLPSDGLLYKNQKSTLKVAYLNAMDESIITNPNLLESGQFLEILINRKMLDTSLRYKDLHVGDRNAIMIWLRSTGYGPKYNITLADPNSIEYKEFEAQIDLSELKIKKLGATPDENGHFDYELPIEKNKLKLRLLTVRDIDDIEEYATKKAESDEFNDSNLYALGKHIVEVDGQIAKEFIKDFIAKMRIGDVRSVREYINSIESGMDMNITVGTPGGGSINTFLPLNFTFFWPDFRV